MKKICLLNITVSKSKFNAGITTFLDTVVSSKPDGDKVHYRQLVYKDKLNTKVENMYNISHEDKRAILKDLNKFDIVYIIGSIQISCKEQIDIFNSILKRVKAKKIYLETNNYKPVMRGKNVYSKDFISEFSSNIDGIMVHNNKNVYIDMIKAVNPDIKVFGDRRLVFIDIKDGYFKQFRTKKKENWVGYIGRHTSWKNPLVLKDLYEKIFKKTDYICYIEGIRMSPGTVFDYYEMSKDKETDKWIKGKEKKNFILDYFYKSKTNRPNRKFEPGKGVYVLAECEREYLLSNAGKAMFIFVPSYIEDEGAGGPIEYTWMEALAVNTIPIIYKKAAKNVVIEDGYLSDYSPIKCGFLFYEEGKEKKLLRQMNRLKDDPELYYKMVKNGKRFIHKNFSVKVLSNYLASINEVILDE